MAKKQKRPIAVFHEDQYRVVGKFILKCRAVAQDFGNNAVALPLPVPTVANFLIDVGKLETAETNAEAKIVGAAALRDAAYQLVVSDLHQWLGYVQVQADKLNNFTGAVNLIQVAGFEVKGVGIRAKPMLKATRDTQTGIITLTAKAAAERAAYNWQYSTDMGSNWVDLPPTLQAKTTANGLPISEQLAFRVKAITKDGAHAWSDAVTL
jgi:hypothetical protein